MGGAIDTSLIRPVHLALLEPMSAAHEVLGRQHCEECLIVITVTAHNHSRGSRMCDPCLSESAHDRGNSPAVHMASLAHLRKDSEKLSKH